VDDEFVARLDQFEGHPKFYQRDVITVCIIKHGDSTAEITEKPEVLKCSVYMRKQFHPALLDKENFSSYDSSGAHGRAFSKE